MLCQLPLVRLLLGFHTTMCVLQVRHSGREQRGPEQEPMQYHGEYSTVTALCSLHCPQSYRSTPYTINVSLNSSLLSYEVIYSVKVARFSCLLPQSI